MIIYADDNDGNIPRGNAPHWWRLYIPALGGTSATRDQYGRIKVYTCPSYPNKRQVICYVVNAWQFSSPRDMTGSELVGLSSVGRVQQPSRRSILPTTRAPRGVRSSPLRTLSARVC